MQNYSNAKQKYYRAKGVAIYLGVTITTIWNYASRGLLTPIKLSENVTVFDIDEVNALIKNATAKVA